jgi:hypothetical protein
VNSGGAETQRAKHGLCPPANMSASSRIHLKSTGEAFEQDDSDGLIAIAEPFPSTRSS